MITVVFDVLIVLAVFLSVFYVIDTIEKIGRMSQNIEQMKQLLQKYEDLNKKEE